MTPTTDRPATVHGGDALDWHEAYKAVVHDLARRTGIPLPLVTGVYWPTHRLPIHSPASGGASNINIAYAPTDDGGGDPDPDPPARVRQLLGADGVWRDATTTLL